MNNINRINKFYLIINALLFGVFLSDCNHSKIGCTNYSIDGTKFSPIVKWIDDSIYRIYIHREDIPFTDDYIEVFTYGPIADAFCVSYGGIILYYNENQPKNIYVISADYGTYVRRIKSDYYNIHYVGNSEIISLGELQMPKRKSELFNDSLYYHMQYRWIISEEDDDIDVYLDREVIRNIKIEKL